MSTSSIMVTTNYSTLTPELQGICTCTLSDTEPKPDRVTYIPVDNRISLQVLSQSNELLIEWLIAECGVARTALQCKGLEAILKEEPMDYLAWKLLREFNRDGDFILGEATLILVTTNPLNPMYS